ncbi:MAG: hypothetical protein HDT32_06585 [Clostridiales bacterium]|nr:hypothetical protein [Clostridiales bacterium]
MEKTKQSIFIENKIYVWIVALLPILSMYKSPISALDLGTFIAIPVLLLCNLTIKRKLKNPFKVLKQQNSFATSFLGVCFYITAITMVNIVIGMTFDRQVMGFSDRLQMLFRCLKLVLMALVIIYCGFRLMRFEYFMRVYWTIIKLAVMYILLQTICFYLFKRVLPPFISRFIREDYLYILDYNYHIGLGLFRPMSFFYEPAHFCEYCIPYLTFLFYRSKVLSKRDFVRAIVVSIGIVLSTSGIGCLFTGVLWILALLRSIKYQKDAKVFLLFIFALCVLPIAIQIPLFQKAFARLFSSGGGAVQIRMGSGYSIFAQIGFLAKIFGIGYGNYPPSYAISMSYSLISLGIIGTIVLLLFLSKIILKTKGYSRALSVVMIFMMFVTMIFTTGLTLYLPCIIFSMKGGKKVAKPNYDNSQYCKQRVAKVS